MWWQGAFEGKWVGLVWGPAKERADLSGAGQIQVYQAILMSDLVACLQQI